MLHSKLGSAISTCLVFLVNKIKKIPVNFMVALVVNLLVLAPLHFNRPLRLLLLLCTRWLHPRCDGIGCRALCVGSGLHVTTVQGQSQLSDR